MGDEADSQPGAQRDGSSVVRLGRRHVGTVETRLEVTEQTVGPGFGAPVMAFARQGERTSGVCGGSSGRLASRYASPRCVSKRERHWTIPMASMAGKASSSNASPSVTRPDSV